MAFIVPGETGRHFRPAPGSTGGGVTPAAPVIISPLTASGTVNTAFNYFITAINSPLSYAASGLPAGLTVNTATGQISGTPPTPTSGTNVTISATNAQGTDSQTLVITIAAAVPVVTGGTINGVANSAITPFQISATNSPTSYAVNPALPTGLSLNTTTGEITGTPTATVSTSVQVTATNSGGTSAPATLNINIAAALQPPVINSSPFTRTGQVGVGFSYTITATNSPTSFNATNLPSWASLSGATISGTPNATVTNHIIGLEATNAAGTGNQDLTLTINPAVPVVTNPGAQTWQVGVPITDISVLATNSPTAYAATNLPGGVTINTTSGLISGTPAAGTQGSRTIGLTATNAGGTSTPVVNMSVTILPTAPVITSLLTATGQAGAVFGGYTIVASGATAFTATPLPAGLSINGTSGVISGTIAASVTPSPPPFSVTIGASNTGGSDSKVLQITIAAQAVPVVTAASLTRPEGTAFTHQIAATNSPTSYAISGEPAGVSVNSATGLISGTATVAQGVYPITMTATNAGGTSAGATLTLTIQPPPAGWTVNHVAPGFPSPPTVFNAITGRMPLNAATWVGWQAAYDADMTDALYDVATPGALPVNMWAKYTTDADYVLVPFDNFGGTPAANSITEWGYDSNVHAVYIIGSNSTSNPIQLRLVKTV